jgi:hypothetical protein
MEKLNKWRYLSNTPLHVPGKIAGILIAPGKLAKLYGVLILSCCYLLPFFGPRRQRRHDVLSSCAAEGSWLSFKN